MKFFHRLTPIVEPNLMYTLNIHYSLQRNDQDKNATGYKFILTNLVVMYEEHMTEDKVRYPNSHWQLHE